MCVCLCVRVSRREQDPLGKLIASGPRVKEMPTVSPGWHCSQSGRGLGGGGGEAGR